MIALVDCNNFYVSCERVFNPLLEGKPVAVLSNNDGCIIARSNEVKAMGIRMGTPAHEVKHLIEKNKIITFSSNYALYGDMSERVMNTLGTIVKDVEIYSIDEAFLDMSGYNHIDSLPNLARQLRQKVRRWTGIPISVGIGPNKTLAKIANRLAKKDPEQDGVCVISSPSSVEEALNKIAVEDIWGVGNRKAKMLKKYHIHNAWQLSQAKDGWIKKHLSVVSLRTVMELRGFKCLPLEMFAPPKKAICTSRSFRLTQNKKQVVEEAIATYASMCGEKLRKQGSHARLVTVFVRTNPFKENEEQYSNCKVLKLPVATDHTPELIHYALKALNMIYREGFAYKKAGVIVSGITEATSFQQPLFDDVNRFKARRLNHTLDLYNQKQERSRQVRYLATGASGGKITVREKLSPNYTTNWAEILEIFTD